MSAESAPFDQDAGQKTRKQRRIFRRHAAIRVGEINDPFELNQEDEAKFNNILIQDFELPLSKRALQLSTKQKLSLWLWRISHKLPEPAHHPEFHPESRTHSRQMAALYIGFLTTAAVVTGNTLHNNVEKFNSINEARAELHAVELGFPKGRAEIDAGILGLGLFSVDQPVIHFVGCSGDLEVPLGNNMATFTATGNNSAQPSYQVGDAFAPEYDVRLLQADHDCWYPEAKQTSITGSAFTDQAYESSTDQQG
jgi:hypothetical protein